MPNYNLSSLLEDTARAFPAREAVVSGGRRLTYAEVNAAANQVANVLAALGVSVGDKVAVTCPNIAEFPIVYYGILKVGATVVPLNTLLQRSEIAYHLSDSNAKMYLCFEDSASEGFVGFGEVEGCRHFLLIADEHGTASIDGANTLKEALKGQRTVFETVATDADDTAVILYTSGTTGKPKGAELRHRNMRDNALLGSDLFAADAMRPDRYLCVLPLFHAFGQTFMQNGAFAFGGTVVMMSRFDARSVVDLMLAEKVSLFAGVPTMYWSLIRVLDERVDVAGIAARIRVAISGGAALPVQVHAEFHERFGITIVEGYGLSETSPAASFSVSTEPIRPGSIGRPVPGVEMTLIDDHWNVLPDGPDVVGEIAIRGHNVMKGYYKRPEATEEVMRDGWFRTGDLARRDADGWYYIVDRAKDLIIRGGENVYPREVEEVLMRHPEISLAAVVGVPHERLGEEIKAFVILVAGARTTPDEVAAWAKARMASYKYPRAVEIVSALPMTATGKILKRELTGGR
ncbi:long-chain-fatty-acid--CoA ligase [Nocardia vinacea]|uniref:long-chain-fatty-acid--CoA ligase n=1 Tax=Nocardia vinacea TaxID=96468 RepID=UPI00031A3A9D|nr:long-chain fatty acid--CoA ligase [Nocardia vinacea]